MTESNSMFKHISSAIASLAISGCALNIATPTYPEDVNLSQLSVRDLCASYAATKDANARSELMRRQEFSDAEWKRIKRGQTKPRGMRESVLWCAWGIPGDLGDIETTTSGATRYRYQVRYSLAFDIIVKDGIVSDFTAR